MKTLMKLTALFALASFFGWHAFGEEEAIVVIGDKVFVSDGSPISIPSEELTIRPPQDWEVVSGFPGVTILFRMPKEEKERVQRSIQLYSFSGSKYIDEITAEEFALELEEKFAESNTSIKDYKIRSHIPVALENGNDAWLFYYGFSINDVDLMHAHLLASSADRHYVLTYTDLQENFVKETTSKDFLGVAWASMTSLSLPNPGPQRLGPYKLLSFLFAALALIALCFVFLKRKKASQTYSDYAQGKIPTGQATAIDEKKLTEDELDDVEVTVHTEVPDEDEQERLHTDLSFQGIDEDDDKAI